jgi:hypothetical protein
MSKYSPKWFANQRRLAEMGVQTTPYNDTFAGTYGTAGGGLAGVKAGQMQYGPSAYTAEEASQLARTGTIPKPAPGVASIFSSSTPAQQETQTSSNQVTSESPIFTPEKETLTPDTQRLTAKEKFDVASGLEQQTLEDFSNLLSRLEASKMKQERKKAVETRQDTLAKGLASMLGNF